MTGTFVSIDNTQYTVNVGSAEGTLILGEDPVHISWSKGDHLFVPIRTSQCSIRVKTSTDLSSLYTESPTGCQVTVYQGETCIFMGYLTPQEWDAPFRGVYDEIELVAVDALAALKQLKYTAAYEEYPSLLTTQSIVDRACALVGITGVPTMRSPSATYANINESAFLPRYQDVSEYSSDRMSWSDVMKAIATWEGYVFMLDGSNAFNMLAVDVNDLVENGTPTATAMRGDDSAGADIRMSIEPAKSRVVVDYQDLNPMELIPEIDTSRMLDTCAANTEVESGSKTTSARYYVSKDWLSQTSRSACGAVVDMRDYSKDTAEEHFCIVGPAIMHYPTINTRGEDLSSRPIHISLSAWARDDMDTDDHGHELLSCMSKSSNFNPVIEFRFTDPLLGSYTCTRTLDISGNEGFSSVSFDLFRLLGETDAVLSGYMRVFIPANCVITGMTAKVSEEYFSSSQNKKVKLSEVENEGITELTASGWNDSVTIEARLRAAEAGYSAADVVNSLIWDKYPFCTTAQFEVPRKRFKATLSGIYQAAGLLSDTDMSTQRLFVDAADIDLKMHRTTVDVIETWTAV